MTKNVSILQKSTPRRRISAPVRLGFIALTDCAPLLVANELALFEKHGVAVELHREVGWATIREKILYRQLDATHSVVGLGLSLRLGLQGMNCPAIVPYILNLNGNAITLSTDLWRRGVRDADSLAKLIRSNPNRLLTFGVVALTSSHNFMLRRWLTSAGINPDKDVRTVVLPPTQMAGILSMGLIDGFCAGDPWNSLAVAKGTGWCAALSEDVLPRHPDKVLVSTEDYAEENEAELKGVIRALHEASIFCDKSENREQVVEILHGSGQLRVDRGVLRMALIGPFDDGTKQRRDVSSFYIFHRDGANEPTVDKSEWLADQFIKNGIATNATQVREESKACYRPDIYHGALAGLHTNPKATKGQKKTSSFSAS